MDRRVHKIVHQTRYSQELEGTFFGLERSTTNGERKAALGRTGERTVTSQVRTPSSQRFVDTSS